MSVPNEKPEKCLKKCRKTIVSMEINILLVNFILKKTLHLKTEVIKHSGLTLSQAYKMEIEIVKNAIRTQKELSL